jgi:hypothetical protein
VTDSLYLFGAGLAVFLVGANCAFLLNLGNRLTRWFTLKVGSVTLLMVYVALSLYVGSPDLWRACIGVAALLLDLVALGWMWYSIESLNRRGYQGLIPLGRITEGK